MLEGRDPGADPPLSRRSGLGTGGLEARPQMRPPPRRWGRPGHGHGAPHPLEEEATEATERPPPERTAWTGAAKAVAALACATASSRDGMAAESFMWRWVGVMCGDFLWGSP